MKASGEREAAGAPLPAFRWADGRGDLVAAERNPDQQAPDVGELRGHHDPKHVIEAD
jgi:hypothetical protein